MYYKSTRNSGLQVSSAAAIAQGISSDGGLFVPSEIPQISMEEIRALSDMSYAERANVVFGKFLTDLLRRKSHTALRAPIIRTALILRRSQS